MLSSLHTNQKLLVIELQKRGADIKLISIEDELLEVNFKGKKEFLLDRFSSKAPFHMVKISADKHLAKEIMRSNGVKVPDGEIFTGHNIDAALKYAYGKYPLVLKPNWGSHGDGVQANILNAQELEIAIWQFVASRSKNDAFIIEKFFEGYEHRLFVTALQGFAVVQREPAKVIGDGIHTIEELALIENDKRKTIKEKQYSSLCSILIDSDVDRFLIKENIPEGIRYIPSNKETIYLRNQSNLAKGGIAIDMTDIADVTVKNMAFTALESFPGLPCLGLDLICTDITKPLNQYAVIEANSSPGLAMHMFPSIGQPRDVASMMADVMFPYIQK